MVAVGKKKLNDVMNRPVYAGFCILELSKLLMFKFHYNHVKKIITKMQNYFLQIQTPYAITFKQRISMKT